MRGLAITLLLCLCGAVAHAAEDVETKRAKAYYEEGLKNYRIGEYRQALESFKAGYLSKRNAVFLYNIGQCYRMLGEAEDAVRQYKAYLNDDPSAENRGDVEGFIADLEQQIQKKKAAAAAAPATDPAGRPPAGASGAATTGSPSAPSAAEEKPRRWWILGVAGGAVVVVGAVALGLALGLPQNAPGRDGSGFGVTYP